jgi:hypothetical protein
VTTFSTVCEDEFGFDGGDVTRRVNSTVDVDDVVVDEDAHDLTDGVALSDCGEELVTEPLPFGRALHDARDVDERDGRRQDLLRGEHRGESGEARIGHRDDTDIGLDGRERVVGGQHVVVRQGVEHG